MSEPRRPPPPAAYVPSKVQSNGEPKNDYDLIDLGDSPPVPPRPPPESIPSETGSKPPRPKGKMPPPPPAPYSRSHSVDKGGPQSPPPPPDARPESGAPRKPSRPRTGETPSQKSTSAPSRPRLPSSSSRRSPEITIVSAQPMESDVIPPPSIKETKKVPPPKPSHPPPPIPPSFTSKESDSPKEDEPVKPLESSTHSEESGATEPKKDVPPKPQRKAPPPKPSRSPPSQQKTGDSAKESPPHNRGSIKKAPPPPMGRPKPPPPRAKTEEKTSPTAEKKDEPKGNAPSRPRPPPPAPFASRKPSIKKTEEPSKTKGEDPSQAPPTTHEAPSTPATKEETPIDKPNEEEPIYAKVKKKPRPPKTDTAVTSSPPEERKDEPITKPPEATEQAPLRKPPPVIKPRPPSLVSETTPSDVPKKSPPPPKKDPPTRKPPSPTNAPKTEPSEQPSSSPTPSKDPPITKPHPPEGGVSGTTASETSAPSSTPPSTSNKSPPTSGETKRKPPPNKPAPSPPTGTRVSPKPVRKAPERPPQKKTVEKESQPAKSTPPPKPAPVARPPQPAKQGTAPARPTGGPPKPSKPPPPSTQPSAKPRPPKPAVPRTSGKRNTTAQDEPPPLPPRPLPGHPLYKYVCQDPHGVATTNKEAVSEGELSYLQGDVIVLIEKVDDFWYWGCNCDNDNEEGAVLASDLKIVKRLPGSDTVAGFDEGPCAVAIHDYEGLSDNELTFKAGDLIMLKAHVGEEWLRGVLMNGSNGIFPKNFVEVVEELPPDAVESPPPPPATPELSPDLIPDGPYCVAIETFSGETADDLIFSRGDVIELVERIDDNWLRGSLYGLVGMFPQSFVDVKVDIKVGVVNTPGVSDDDGNVVKGTYDYDTGEEGDLIFMAGDRITVLSKVNEEWLYGELNGKKGQFPAAFVDRVPPNLPSQAPSSPSPPSQTTPNKEESSVAPTGECQALYDFETDAPGELSFLPGEVIITTEKINDDWMYGRIGDREGIFPLSLVKVVKELVVPSGDGSKDKLPKNPKAKMGGKDDSLLPKGVAISDFEPASSAEIQLKTGDDIFLLSKEDNQWFVGENLRTGEIGNFPISFINVIVPLP